MPQVFGPKCTQAELYGQAIQPIVTEMLEGFNCTIFAYGQTGTGEHPARLATGAAEQHTRSLGTVAV